MDELRSHIDRIDDELVGLLNDRQALILEIGELKKVAQLGPHDPDREREMLKRLGAISAGPLGEEELTQIYGEILNVSREAQRRIREEGE